jgi:LCP family protein required for cell wall assembly
MMSRYEESDGGGWDAPRQRWRPTRRGTRQPVSRRRASVWVLVTGWLAAVLVVVLVAAALGAYVKYRTVWDSIKRIDATSLGKQPPKYNNAENILLLGSDNRSGANGAIGGSEGCNCSDTLMLLHISPGHHRVTVISIPRDTMVPILSCPADKQAGAVGQQAGAPGELERINAALSTGGPICTWKTVDYVTDIHIDHFIQLDFTGFEKVIDDIGGVNVCLPFAVDDTMSGLHLSAGRHHVLGREALAFWRTREDLGYGSDLQRIQRDQLLMASLVQGIERSGLLNSPTKILSVVKDAADAMETDSGLEQSTMLQIAESLRGLSSSSVQFITAPNVPYPGDPLAEVQLEQPQASTLFHAIAHDTKLPKPKKPAKSKSSVTTPVVDAVPSKVNVNVLNGAGINGLAGQAGTDLTGRGFNVVSTGDASTTGYTDPVIEYASATDLPAVDTLKAQLTGVTVHKDTGLTPGIIDLIVGSNFNGLASKSPSSTSTPSVDNLSTAFGGVTANTNICNDQAAFAGPDSPIG